MNKKPRNDKMNGQFYTDEYIHALTKRIYDLEKENEKLTTNLTKDEHDALEELLNEELLEYLKSGYNLTDGYPVLLRGLINKLGCSEIYPYDKWYGDEDEDESEGKHEKNR